MKDFLTISNFKGVQTMKFFIILIIFLMLCAAIYQAIPSQNTIFLNDVGGIDAIRSALSGMNRTSN